jgi:hypothetical protein
MCAIVNRSRQRLFWGIGEVRRGFAIGTRAHSTSEDFAL